jgi:hypothetical protein
MKAVGDADKPAYTALRFLLFLTLRLQTYLATAALKLETGDSLSRTVISVFLSEPLHKTTNGSCVNDPWHEYTMSKHTHSIFIKGAGAASMTLPLSSASYRSLHTIPSRRQLSSFRSRSELAHKQD